MSTTDCEIMSLTPSSPSRSQASERPVYYVHSPSRDSDDSEKTVMSTHSTPALMSPMASSTHSTPALMIPMVSSTHSTPALMSPMASSHSSAERRYQDSSSTGFSTSIKPRGPCRKNTPFDSPGRKGTAQTAAIMRRLSKGDDHFAAIEEEGLLEADEEDKGLYRRRHSLAFLVGFAFLFSIFTLILWCVSRSQKPQITMKSIKFENLFIQAGIDASLVPTDMVTLNCTVRLTFRNTGTFFGVHVSAALLELAYNKLVLASGSMNTFYQSRKSQRGVDVALLGNKVPLYGGGESMAAGRRAYPPIPLRLSFMVKARAYVLGRLVMPKFQMAVQCSVTMDHAKLTSSVSLNNSCQYH